MTATTIVWFRQDLRLHDNPALEYALRHGSMLPIYILDDESSEQWKLGGASRWWLHHSLKALAECLKHYGHQLQLFVGDPVRIIPSVIQQTKAKGIVWNRCYEPYAIERDQSIKGALNAMGIEARSFSASVLFEPWTIANQQGAFFKVFTPFWKHCLRQPVESMADSVPMLTSSQSSVGAIDGALSLEVLNLLPTRPNWAAGFDWQVGEAAALSKLDQFIQASIHTYKDQRDFMDQDATSKLSPHLHFGEISPRLIYHRCQEVIAIGQGDMSGVNHFVSELGWREFSYHLLYHFPKLPTSPFRSEFSQFAWSEQPEALKQWQQGKTGFPVVDAAMRELWHTGYMHNRARMIVASFLTKNLLIHWRYGVKWFWDTLVDADLASNSASWQWVAGCGVDVAPYFRIFNPVMQGERFDPDGAYVKRWVPELADLETKYIHQPWTAPLAVLKDAGIRLGYTYPHVMVDLKATRERALQAYAGIK